MGSQRTGHCNRVTFTFRASLVAQLVKKPPAMWETWIRSLGWEDPWRREKATHSNILAWRIPWTVAHQASLSMTFSRKEYWSELPCPPPGNFLNPGIKSRSPALQMDSLPSQLPGKLLIIRFGTAISQKQHYGLSILIGGSIDLSQYWQGKLWPYG